MYLDKAKHIVARLAQLDLDDEEQREAAVARVARALMSAVDGEAWTGLIERVEGWKTETTLKATEAAYGACLNAIREAAVVCEYPALEDWWATTAYEDVISPDDQLFREKPINLKRVAIEAFNAARRSRRVEA